MMDWLIYNVGAVTMVLIAVYAIGAILACGKRRPITTTAGMIIMLIAGSGIIAILATAETVGRPYNQAVPIDAIEEYCRTSADADSASQSACLTAQIAGFETLSRHQNRANGWRWHQERCTRRNAPGNQASAEP